MYVIIAGAGMVGGELARRLMENKHDVVVIDKDKQLCEDLYAETGVLAIPGDAANIGVLLEAGIDKADVVVAATSSDAGNLSCAVMAKSFNVPRIIARMRNPNYERAYQVAGVTTVVRMIDLLVNQILTEVEQPKAKKIITIGGGRADIFMITIPQGAKVAGKTVSDIAKLPKFPSQCVFIAVYNQEVEKFAIPRGSQEIQEGDQIFLISSAEDINVAAEILTQT